MYNKQKYLFKYLSTSNTKEEYELLYRESFMAYTTIILNNIEQF